jgi:serine/threonine protein kinase
MSDKTIRGYQIVQPFKVVGGGRCKWTFAIKDKKEYFIKQYLAPKYPVEGSPGSAKTKVIKLAECEKFNAHHTKLKETIKSRVSGGGNLVSTIEFFREGTFFYKVTEKVDVTTLSPKEVAKLPIEKRIRILLTILSSMKVLHACDIVHGDLKPDNILIKKTDRDEYIAKLIDFDDSYFAGNAPDITDDENAEEIVGTIDYYSPELGSYVKQNGTVAASDLGLAADIFALGIIFSEYLTGRKPTFDTKKYRYAWESALNGQPVTMEPFTETKTSGMPRYSTASGSPIAIDQIRQIINLMLDVQPKRRPNISEIFSNIKAIMSGSSATIPLPIITDKTTTATKSAAITEPTRTGGKLIATGFTKTEASKSPATPTPEPKPPVTRPAAPSATPPVEPGKSRLIIGPGFGKRPTDAGDETKK